MPKCSKFHAKSIQNPSKIDPRASPERPLRTVEKSIEKSMLKVTLPLIEMGPMFAPKSENQYKKTYKFQHRKYHVFFHAKRLTVLGAIFMKIR